jgi:isopenicillin N synthase-like dioxygenase
MEVIGQRVLCAVSRGLGIPERIFADAFRDGISTLRLLHYIPRGDLPISDEERESRGEHVDSGLLTLLAFCCGCGGLQVKTRDGEWIDVPAEDDVIAVNFGGLMARWTGGKIRATPHGVIPTREERFSIPFFFEPRPDTRIEPLPLPEVEPFEPFLFGDHLWNTTTRFAENYGLGPLRPNRAPYRDPLARVE